MKMTFDQIQRYRLAARVIDLVRREKPASILDAGSREGFLSRFLPGDRIVNLDRSFFRARGFVQGDVRNLPFASGRFQVTLACDLLEHVAPEKRPDLLRELERVSQDLVVIASPFFDPEVIEAEKLVNEFTLRLTGKANEFLAEHLRFGLPRLDSLVAWAEGSGYQTLVLPNGYLYRWLAMISLNTYLSQLPEPWDLIFSVNEFYDRHFGAREEIEPAYRRLVVISKTRRLDEERVRSDLSSPAREAGQPLGLEFVRELSSTIDLGKDRILKGLEEKLENEIGKLTGIIAGKTEQVDKLEQSLIVALKDLDETRVRLGGKEKELKEIKSTRSYRFYRSLRRIFGRLSSRPRRGD